MEKRHASWQDTHPSGPERLAALDALDPATNTAADYTTAMDNLNQSANDLLAASSDLIDQDIENINNAGSALRDSLDGVGDMPLAEAGDAVGVAVEAQVAELNAFYAEAYANSSCS